MKKTIWAALVLIALLVAGFFGLRSCQREGWVRTLKGPYTGNPITGTFTNSPVSVLTLPSRGRLEVHEVASQAAPALVLRSENGAVQWARLLVPERRLDDGRVEHAGVRELRLRRIEPGGAGYAVLFSCEWDWGGKEGGLIDLDSEYGFKSFRISW